MSTLRFVIAVVLALALSGGMFLFCLPVSADARSALITTVMFFVAVLALILTIAQAYKSPE